MPLPTASFSLLDLPYFCPPRGSKSLKTNTNLFPAPTQIYSPSLGALQDRRFGFQYNRRAHVHESQFTTQSYPCPFGDTYWLLPFMTLMITPKTLRTYIYIYTPENHSYTHFSYRYQTQRTTTYNLQALSSPPKISAITKPRPLRAFCNTFVVLTCFFPS